MKSLGVDLGGHTIVAALVEDGVIVGRSGEATAGRDPGLVIPQIAAMVERLGADSTLPVGIGIPGMLDRDRERAILMPNFAGWNGIPLRTLLATAVRRPVFLENDANCYAIGEGGRGGAAEGIEDYILLTLGTGIGGGIISGGRIFRGFHGMAGEAGHMAVGGTELCGCSSRGHAEAIAGADAVERKARSMGLPADLKSLWKLRKDPGAAPLWEDVLDTIARTVASAVHLLDPQAVILGGGVARGEGLLQALAPRVSDYLAPPFRERLDLRLGTLGSDGAVLGAAVVAGRGILSAP